jgi:uncharacterized protein (DUF427 family)
MRRAGREGAGNMVKAVWNGAVIADSDHTIVLDGHHYFPSSTVKAEFLKTSTTTVACKWKGLASHISVMVEGEQNTDAAWRYDNPTIAASAIRGRIAFSKGVVVS